MSGERSRWYRALASTTLLLLLVLFARHVDWRAAAAAARGADVMLLGAALVANQLSLMLKGVRWWIFLRPLGVSSLRLVLRATYAGASLNNLVIAQGGEAARVLLVSKASGVAAARVISALALERALDAVSYLALLVGAAMLLHLPESIGRWRVGASVALGCAIAALLWLGATSRTGTQAPVAGHSVRSRVASALSRFAESMSEMASPTRLLLAMVLSVGAWALQLATYHAVALAAHLPISIGGSAAAMLAVGVSFLLRATPGNVGIFQVIYAMTVTSFGAERPAAVATAVLIQAVQIIPTVGLGTVAAWGIIGRPPGRNGSRRSPTW